MGRVNDGILLIKLGDKGHNPSFFIDLGLPDVHQLSQKVLGFFDFPDHAGDIALRICIMLLCLITTKSLNSFLLFLSNI